MLRGGGVILGGVPFGAGAAREWRNRQTRTVQVRVPARAWGFNSPLAHHEGSSSQIGAGQQVTAAAGNCPEARYVPTVPTVHSFSEPMYTPCPVVFCVTSGTPSFAAMVCDQA